MANLPLTFTGYEYWDRSKALMDGSVEIDGVDLTYNMAPADLFQRNIEKADFEASEMSTSFMIMMYGKGDRRLVCLPLFTAREFFHGRIFINPASGIKRPEDLKGKRIGLPDYAMTAAIWIRGMIHHEYGVTAQDAKWFCGGFDRPVKYVQRMPLDLPSDISLTVIPETKSIVGMLLDGELDAVASPGRPKPFVDGDPRILRLFPNYAADEKAYYRKTKLFPTVHVVVLRRDVYEANPWLAKNMMDAFSKAKDIGWNTMKSNLRILSMPWLSVDLEETEGLFSGSPFRHGFEANRAALEALVRYGYEQGLTRSQLSPEELFAPESLTWTGG
ncbi:MAG: ABC transporter substrate-binding protein [Dehalococcoidia bacterium]|nr:ABC transporter substrate-binding protein [Dehalococcoidia bacterium]